MNKLFLLLAIISGVAFGVDKRIVAPNGNLVLDAKSGSTINAGKIVNANSGVAINSATNGALAVKGTGNTASSASSIEIGQNSGDGKINVHGPTYTTNGLFRQDAMSISADDSLSGGLTIGARHASGVIDFYAGGTSDSYKRMTLLSDGKFGVGPNFTPTSQFQVLGTGTIPTIANNRVASIHTDGDVTGLIITNGNASQASAMNLGLYSKRGPSSSYTFFNVVAGDGTNYNVQNVFQIRGDGAVGIGVGTLNAKLNVHSDMEIQGNTTRANGAIMSFSSGSTIYSVSTSPTSIPSGSGGGNGGLTIITGSSGGDSFSDVISWSNISGVTVLSSKTTSGSPSSRTYGSGSGLTLTMGSGTYSVTAKTMQ